MNQQKEKQKHVAGPSINPGTAGSRVRHTSDCAMPPRTSGCKRQTRYRLRSSSGSKINMFNFRIILNNNNWLGCPNVKLKVHGNGFMFSIVFSKTDNCFCDFLFASKSNKTLKERSLLIKERICSQNKLFPLIVDPQ